MHVLVYECKCTLGIGSHVPPCRILLFFITVYARISCPQVSRDSPVSSPASPSLGKSTGIIGTHFLPAFTYVMGAPHPVPACPLPSSFSCAYYKTNI